LAEFPPVWSVAGDIRGEAALRYMPPPSSPGEQALIVCDAVSHCDAWSAAVLRTLLEYAATRLLMPITLSLPSDQNVRVALTDALGTLPNGVQLARDTKLPTRTSHNVIMPATRVRNLGLAEAVAEHLPGTSRSAGASRRELNFLALVLLELLTNALAHGKSPVEAVASVGYEAEEDELQLVVCDLGQKIARQREAGEVLSEAWKVSEKRGRRTPSGLPGIGAMAMRRSMNLSLSIFSGTGRVFWRAGKARFVSEEPFIPGFTAAVVLHR
jgi:anti-sigma regulatory factor (Ser/Thr protein kinase)